METKEVGFQLAELPNEGIWRLKINELTEDAIKRLLTETEEKRVIIMVALMELMEWGNLIASDAILKKNAEINQWQQDYSDLQNRVINQNKELEVLRQKRSGLSPEDHVFEATITRTGEKVWRYFYTDDQDLNQHSPYYKTREEALFEYRKRFMPEELERINLIKDVEALREIVIEKEKEAVKFVEWIRGNVVGTTDVRGQWWHLSSETYIKTTSDLYAMYLNEGK